MRAAIARYLLALGVGLALCACSGTALPNPTTEPADPVGTAVALTVAALPTSSRIGPASDTPAPLPSDSPSPRASATPTPAPPPTDTPAPAVTPQPEEEILILLPGPGSKVISPVTVSGIANPTQHQQVLVELVGEDGSVLASELASINAEAGQRGPFFVNLPFSDGGQAARVQVSVSSPRDGGLTHLSSVGIELLASGTAKLVPGQHHSERIHIASPAPGAVLTGGVVEVRGEALASFEQTLVVEVLDADGTVITQIVAIVEALDLGLPGPFSVMVPYGVISEQPGRIVVKDVSVGIPGLIHLASVEVTLRP